MSRLTQITIPAPTTWINSNQRLHRMQTAKLTAAWRAATAQRLHERGWDLTPYEGTVRIVAHIYKPRLGRYDPGNLYPTAKACIDGIVDAGLLNDDDYKHVIGPDMRHGGKGPPAITLTITQEETHGD